MVILKAVISIFTNKGTGLCNYPPSQYIWSMEHTTKPRPRNLGRKVRHMRELLNFTQEDVANKMGVSQQTISNIESNEEVEAEQLEKVARAMGVTADAIKDLNEDAAVYNIIQNNYEGSTNEGASNFVGGYNNHYSFNPVEKWLEAMKKNEKLYEELLKSEREKVAMMERILKEKKDG